MTTVTSKGWIGDLVGEMYANAFLGLTIYRATSSVLIPSIGIQPDHNQGTESLTPAHPRDTSPSAKVPRWDESFQRGIVIDQILIVLSSNPD